MFLPHGVGKIWLGSWTPPVSTEDFRGKLQRHARSHGLLSCLRLSFFLSFLASLTLHARTRVDTRTDPRSISRSLSGRREHKGKKREYGRRSNGPPLWSA
ncbi:hypothetical protein PUN28_016612 [Cardiocondyla obscurior]|uniref:Secreted protein n=1 Tax=Cardiocondyla obscurior TaxID=286306 RepID=A0AAW2EQ87_9HYME